MSDDDDALALLRKFAPWAFGDYSGPPGFDYSATYTHLETPEESEARVLQWRRERGLDDPEPARASLTEEELSQFHDRRALLLQQAAADEALGGKPPETADDLQRAMDAADNALAHYYLALGNSKDGGLTLNLPYELAVLLETDRERLS